MRSFVRSGCLVVFAVLFAVPVAVITALAVVDSREEEPVLSDDRLAESLMAQFDQLVARLRTGVRGNVERVALVEAFAITVRPALSSPTRARMILRENEFDIVGHLPLLFVDTDSLVSKYAPQDNGLPLQFVGNGFLYYPTRPWSESYFVPVAVREIVYWQRMEQDTDGLDLVDVAAYSAEFETLDRLVEGRLSLTVRAALQMTDVGPVSVLGLRSPGELGMTSILRAWPGTPASEAESYERIKLTIAAIAFVQLNHPEDRLLALRHFNEAPASDE